MGTILNAICKQKCGFKEDDIYLGGGRMNFTTVCDVPALNKKTGEFLVLNYFDKPKLSEDIVFYNSPELYEDNKDGTYPIHWDNIYLNRANNLCPKCGAFSLDFLVVGFFD